MAGSRSTGLLPKCHPLTWSHHTTRRPQSLPSSFFHGPLPSAVAAIHADILRPDSLHLRLYSSSVPWRPQWQWYALPVVDRTTLTPVVYRFASASRWLWPADASSIPLPTEPTASRLCGQSRPATSSLLHGRTRTARSGSSSPLEHWLLHIVHPWG